MKIYLGCVISGQTFVTDDAIHLIPATGNTHLADLLEAKGFTWKLYQEDYPGNCFVGDAYPYVQKHNPFISFSNIQGKPRCANIANSAQFDADVAAYHNSGKPLPNFMFYTPNMRNDGHDTTVLFSGDYLRNSLWPRYISLMCFCFCLIL